MDFMTLFIIKCVIFTLANICINVTAKKKMKEFGYKRVKKISSIEYIRLILLYGCLLIPYFGSCLVVVWVIMVTYIESILKEEFFEQTLLYEKE